MLILFQLIKEAQLNSSISTAFTSLLLVNQSKDDRHQMKNCSQIQEFVFSNEIPLFSCCILI